MPQQSEVDFLKTLERKAGEERRVLATEMMPNWARGIGQWLVVKPWRVMVPLAGIMYFVLRIMLGISFRELVLGIFGGY